MSKDKKNNSTSNLDWCKISLDVLEASIKVIKNNITNDKTGGK